jgi:hypothetical protein
LLWFLAWWNVRVHAEHIRRIEAILERCQPLQSLAICSLDARSTFIRDEVGVDTDAVRTKRFPTVANPGLMAIAIWVGWHPGGGEAHIDPNFALADSCRSWIDAAHRSAHDPAANLRERRSNRFNSLNERIDNIVRKIRQSM